MKTAARWIMKLFGRKRRVRHYVMNAQVIWEDHDALDTFIKTHTPVITAAQYNRLPDDVKKLFVKVGK